MKDVASGKPKSGAASRKAVREFPLDPRDRLILNEIQRNFPIVRRPYLALARRLGLKEKEVFERERQRPGRRLRLHPLRG